MVRGPSPQRQAMGFEALYHADLLHPVNPTGDVGIITLWTPFRAAERKLREQAPHLLDPESSRIAVIANLYGDGMFAMFCNLLNNPQVRHLVALGQDLGLGASDEIAAFLEHGLEDATILGRQMWRVRDTQRVFPPTPGFDDGVLRERLSFHRLGKLSSPALAKHLIALLDGLPRREAAHDERVRVRIPTGATDGRHLQPSEVAAHQVVRRKPLDCWEELIVRTMRFGRPVRLSKGSRLELLNARAVITEPAEDTPGALAEFGFDIERFSAYQDEILEPELPEGIAYTYGHRLRGYYDQGLGTDTLGTVIAKLRDDPHTRGAYIALWDSSADISGKPQSAAADKPCLTTLFFRAPEDRLTLTATYRSHNMLSAWLMNVYGLIAIQRHVAAGAGIEVGPLTVISHSLGIDPDSPRFALAEAMVDRWTRDDDVDRETGKSSLRDDPNGYFIVSIDRGRGCIVADHMFDGVPIKRYEGKRAETIEHEVAADMAVSLVSHALWLGRELARNEQALRAGSSEK